jgi:hypothetical protein
MEETKKEIKFKNFQPKTAKIASSSRKIGVYLFPSNIKHLL